MDLNKVTIYDIELLACHFSITFANIEFSDVEDMAIDQFQDDRYKLAKKLKDRSFDYMCGFNNIGYDWQVLQYFLDNYEKWHDLSALQVVEKMYAFSQEIIDNQNYELPPPYREAYFSIPQIDLFSIWHFNNVNRKTSLKFIEFSTNFENLEEMSVHHSIFYLTVEQREELDGYRRNDVKATCLLLKFTLGETDHPLYKGMNKIELRENIQKEFGFGDYCLNWNDVKIGDELNKKNYCDLKKIDKRRLYDIKKGARTRHNFYFKDCFPSYVNFQLPEFQSFIDKLGKVKVNMNEKQEFIFSYNGTDYNIAKGGIHSNMKPGVIEPKEGEKYISADIGSQYPNAIRKRRLFPSHLGEIWNKIYSSNIQKRLEAKALFKETKDPKYDALQGAYKLILNGSYGKLNERTNWQYDGYAAMCVTIGSQVDILMLIERLERSGIHVVTANTDSIDVIFPNEAEGLYYKICKEWEEEVGNDILGKLEYDEYSKVVMTSINDYLAVTKEGKIKVKGDFVSVMELHKNKSKSIIPIALQAYYKDNTPIEETIKNHKEIFDFCICQKATRQFHYIGRDMTTGYTNHYNKMIRYFVSTTGEKLLKIKNEDTDSKAPKVRECEAGDYKCTLFNKAFFYDKMEDYNIDYQYYIDKTLAIIHKIEPEKKRLHESIKKQQLSLF